MNNNLFEGSSGSKSNSPPKLFDHDEKDDEVINSDFNHKHILIDKHEELI